MANVTFSSPRMPKDRTVYAVAGDTQTLLSVAQAHKIPLDFECENGECLQHVLFSSWNSRNGDVPRR